jgi:hypothetical protein
MNDPIKVLFIGENLDHDEPISKLLEQQSIAEFSIIKAELEWHGREELIAADNDCVLFESSSLGQHEQAWLQHFKRRPQACPGVITITAEAITNPAIEGNSPCSINLLRRGLTAEQLAIHLKAVHDVHKANTQLLGERKALADEHENLNHQLQERQAHGETVAHDLKKPVQSINASLKLLERRLWEFEGLTSHDRQLLAKCIDGSDRMQQLIADALKGESSSSINPPLPVKAKVNNRVPRLDLQSKQEVFFDNTQTSNSECVVVKNQSIGGYGCRYGGSHSFRKGDRVRLSKSGPEYEVRWTDLDEEGQLNFGLQELN